MTQQLPGRFLQGNSALVYQRWNTLPHPLGFDGVRWVYLGPDGSRWDLAGPDAGRQGVQWASELQGAMHMPYEHLLTETAYQMGATYERTNVLKRTINVGAMIGSQTRKLTKYQFSMVESKWWAAWPTGVPGWLGCHTRLGGWRWIPVMEAKASDTSEKRDPTYADNNTMTWDMQLLAVRPWYSKRMVIESFKAQAANFKPGHMYDEKTIAIANRGNMPQWLKFQYTGPGKAWVQDGMLERLVPLPKITATESPTLVDCDEGARTLTAASDPTDTGFYELLRASKIATFILHDLLGDPMGVPVWQRGNGIRFTSMIPPHTVANIKVRHDHPEGEVTVMCPQWFTRPR